MFFCSSQTGLNLTKLELVLSSRKIPRSDEATRKGKAETYVLYDTIHGSLRKSRRRQGDRGQRPPPTRAGQRCRRTSDDDDVRGMTIRAEPKEAVDSAAKDAWISSQGGDAGLETNAESAEEAYKHRLLESLPFDEARPLLSSEILQLIEPSPQTEEDSLANPAGIEFFPSFIPVPRCCHWISATLCFLVASGFVASPIQNTIRGHELSVPDIVLFVIFALAAFAFGVYFAVRGQRNYRTRRPLFEGSAWPGKWKAGYYTVRQECLLEFTGQLVSQFPSECILRIYPKSSGSGGGRAISYFVDYAPASRNERLQERKSRRLHVDNLVGRDFVRWFERAQSG